VKERKRSILHVDLDPFFVSVERSLDPSLRGRRVVVAGGTEPEARVAVASSEARAAGVRPGQSVREALRLCPDAVVRPGDLETYARVGDEVASFLLSVSRRVEQPSSDEAYLDLTPEGADASGPVAAAESIKDQLQRRLGLDASLGLASTRLAARVASSWAKPRGLLLVLPGYESSFLAGRPLSFLELPPHVEAALRAAGLDTIGAVAGADEPTLSAAVGAALAPQVHAAARGENDDVIPVAAPPAIIQEEATIRDRRSDAGVLKDVLEGLVHRAAQRLRPFSLVAEQVTVEVRRREGTARRSLPLRPGAGDAAALLLAARELAEPLFEQGSRVRGLVVRLGKLSPLSAQALLFPTFPRAI
jgi:DNA polymerase-4